MADRKPGIPAVVGNQPEHLALRSIKETLEIMTGARTHPLTTLASNASLADVISKVNEIINRLNH